MGLALLPALALAATTTYTYDELGRLKVVQFDASLKTAYTLDAGGNRTTVATSLVAGTLQFTASTASVAENLGPVTLTVTRTGGSGGAASVNCTATAGTATGGSDYNATPATLNWADGDATSKSCAIGIVDDLLLESAETFTVNLSGVTGATLGTTTSVVVSILDDEDAPPSTPTGLSASGVSSTQINLSWTASTDNIGVTGYRVERCTGVSCSTGFTEVGTPAGTIFNDTPLTPLTTYGYRVRAVDTATQYSPYTAIVYGTTPPDTTPPTTPGTLSGTAISSSQVNLTWGASTDAGGSGLAGYKVERCLDSNCTYAQIGTSPTTSYSDTTTVPLTTYRYRVQAYDNASPANNSTYSNVVNVITPDGYVQITDSIGLVIPSAASLYTSGEVCVPAPTATICTRTLKKANGTAVWSFVNSGAACPFGASAIMTTGYQRPAANSCQINVLASIYGQ